MYGGLNFLLRCNYDSRFLKQTGMPQFDKVMLQYFHELKSSYETDLGQDLVLFNNKEILIDSKTFFYNCGFRKGFSEFMTSLRITVLFSHIVNSLQSIT